MIQFSTPELQEIYIKFATKGYAGFITGIHNMIMKYQNVFQLHDQCIILGNLSFLYYYSDNTKKYDVYLRPFYFARWNEIIPITDTWEEAWYKAILNHNEYYPDPIIYFGNNENLRTYGQIVK